MQSKSLWMEVAVAPHAPQLVESMTCDVVVIGAGIAGISTAYELSEQKLSVIVLDRGKIAAGITSRTTAHLAPLCDDLMSEFQKLHGKEHAKLFYQSHAAAVDRIEVLQKKHSIDCDFRRLDGFLFQGRGSPIDVIDQELEAVREAGAPVHRLVGVPLRGCEGRHTLKYPRQATFHPLKYLKGVVQVCGDRGVRFFADTPALEIENKEGGLLVRTPSATISAAKVVVTTNSPISTSLALHTKMAPYRTYAMAFPIKRGALDDALFWDTEEPYHYVRIQPGNQQKDFVIVGGEDHKSGTTDDAEERLARLESWARSLIPELEDATYRWSGQVLDTIDYAGFIGHDPDRENVYISTGDSGQGITHGVLGSMLNASLIAGKPHPWSELYLPERKPLKAAWNFFSENITAIENFAEYVGPGDKESVEALKPGEGGIIRSGIRKIAAYRDGSGALHLNSAACTHANCHLHWNSFERCWDCPCHGSMFSAEGKPINAPALESLKQLDTADIGQPIEAGQDH